MQSEHLKTRVTHILRRQPRSCCRLDFQCSGDREEEEEEEDYLNPKRVSVLRPSNQTNRSSSPPFSLVEPWQKSHAASHTPRIAFRHLPVLGVWQHPSITPLWSTQPVAAQTKRTNDHTNEAKLSDKMLSRREEAGGGVW